ncbi:MULTISPECIES: anti-sigma factor [Paraburkholderia]|uniref:anti-sigma factor n=1 Tax=Paraburkholderia TaxID=1822464 RepID=UPI0022551EE7|nr:MULTISPECIES: anti-sigma factor [Paraburkholderia]MCX4162450.1 anti-sigma factor [Paraburkholderia megapolitana]MDN7157945.1 anti-sigma factor [Paraburkholderia sp. CHISQ3]MDQ6494992.1 anti-sigma factor [Paraburkholderia megapolitana]
MKPDEIQLLAYVNGELPAHERAEIEQALRSSPDVAEQVALLHASQLPYREAFARQKLPPVPAGLAQKIDDLARAAAQKDSTPQSGANDPVMPQVPGAAPAAPVRSRLRFAPAWLAVAFVAGAFVCGAVLRLGPGAAASLQSGSVGNEGSARSWVVAAAGYQQLYSRDTLEYVDGNADLSKKTLDEIRSEDGLAVNIPDLRAAGLTFKRVQRLRFGDKALVQIVYLPQQGAPVALCVMKETKPDQAVAERRIDSMNVVTWRQAELGYALIGKPDQVDLAALAKRISGNQVDSLFGDAALPGRAPHVG